MIWISPKPLKAKFVRISQPRPPAPMTRTLHCERRKCLTLKKGRNVSLRPLYQRMFDLHMTGLESFVCARYDHDRASDSTCWKESQLTTRMIQELVDMRKVSRRRGSDCCHDDPRTNLLARGCHTFCHLKALDCLRGLCAVGSPVFFFVRWVRELI